MTNCAYKMYIVQSRVLQAAEGMQLCIADV